MLVTGSLTAAEAGTHPRGMGSTKTVRISGFRFEPRTVRIGVGTRVRFVNSSDMTHTATDEGAFDTGDIRPGRRAVVAFRRKGVFPYHCAIHPFMRGKIVVR
jgi:plastocyanin